MQSIGLKEGAASLADYPFSIPAIRKLGTLNFVNPVTILIGDNGSGKSTLLEAIAQQWGLNAEGGSRNFFFSPSDATSRLHEFLRLVKGPRLARDAFFLRAEGYQKLAVEIDRLGVEGSYGGTSLHKRSHGEGFWALLNNRLLGDGFYIFDEPETALSPTTQLAVLRKINELSTRGSQFIIATHSPIIMGSPNADLLQLDIEGFHRTAFEETEHYAVMSKFLKNRHRLLDELLRDD